MFLGFNPLWTFGFVIVSQVLVINAEDSVPVLLRSGDGENSLHEFVDPFHLTSREEFEDILNKKLEKSSPPLLVFFKENFCVEDIVQNEEHLNKLKNPGMTILPAVQSPMTVFRSLAQYNLTKDADDLESVAESQLAIVQITDLDEVPDIFNRIRKTSPNLFVALTGKSCIYSRSERVRRAEPAAEVKDSNETSVYFEGENGKVLFYTSQLPYIKTSENSSFEQLFSFSNASSNVKSSNDSTILTIMFTQNGTSKVDTKFNFTLVRGYYRLNSVKFADVKEHLNGTILTLQKHIFIPKTFSYQCAQNIIFRDKENNVNLKFKDLYIQLDAKNKFGDAYNCVGFTTIPIWAGLFVTSILAIILIWGLTMIMDIRTMDRFDDPKGKTITISAQE